MLLGYISRCFEPDTCFLAVSLCSLRSGQSRASRHGSPSLLLVVDGLASRILISFLFLGDICERLLSHRLLCLVVDLFCKTLLLEIVSFRRLS
jgi:hypothetical protein